MLFVTRYHYEKRWAQHPIIMLSTTTGIDYEDYVSRLIIMGHINWYMILIWLQLVRRSCLKPAWVGHVLRVDAVCHLQDWMISDVSWFINEILLVCGCSGSGRRSKRDRSGMIQSSPTTTESIKVLVESVYLSITIVSNWDNRLILPYERWNRII